MRREWRRSAKAGCHENQSQLGRDAYLSNEIEFSQTLEFDQLPHFGSCGTNENWQAVTELLYVLCLSPTVRTKWLVQRYTRHPANRLPDKYLKMIKEGRSNATVKAQHWRLRAKTNKFLRCAKVNLSFDHMVLKLDVIRSLTYSNIMVDLPRVEHAELSKIVPWSGSLVHMQTQHKRGLACRRILSATRERGILVRSHNQTK